MAFEAEFLQERLDLLRVALSQVALRRLHRSRQNRDHEPRQEGYDASREEDRQSMIGRRQGNLPTSHRSAEHGDAAWNVTQAERAGFEPADRISPITDLANRRFRPLSHLSGTLLLIIPSAVTRARAGAIFRRPIRTLTLHPISWRPYAEKIACRSG